MKFSADRTANPLPKICQSSSNSAARRLRSGRGRRPRINFDACFDTKPGDADLLGAGNQAEACAYEIGLAYVPQLKIIGGIAPPPIDRL